MPGGGGGAFFGGYMVKRLGLTLRGSIKFIIICTIITLFSINTTLLRCDNVGLAGITTTHNNTRSGAFHNTTSEAFTFLDHFNWL